MKVGFISLGCAKNQVNCEQMIWQTYEAGYEVALGAEDCDVAVVNTCGFLEEARQEALAEIDALAQAKADGRLQKILVTGCMAQWWKDQIQERCPQADGFVGVGGYEDIAQVIGQCLNGERPAHFGDIDAPVPETDRVVCTSDHWAWLRIAEGCDNRCAYCIIPYIRGKFRSRPEEAILAEAAELAQAGMKELIVVAQDITRYGLDLYGQRTLARLLPKLCAIEGIQWVRLHYLYPDEITDELIDVIANEPKIVKCLDIPIQHISDRVLRSMHRRGDRPGDPRPVRQAAREDPRPGPADQPHRGLPRRDRGGVRGAVRVPPGLSDRAAGGLCLLPRAGQPRRVLPRPGG